MAYIYLALAISGELLGTTLLKYSQGFRNLTYGIGSLICYGICFYLFSKSLQGINLSIAYATWSGVGIIASTIISIFVFNEGVTMVGIAGILLMVAGIVILNIFGVA